MDIPIRDVTQVLLDQILAYQKVLPKDTENASGTQAGLITDDASMIQKAGELAKEVLQTEKPEVLSVDWAEVDSPENAYQAAKSILKYGI